MLATLTEIVSKDPDFDPLYDEFNLQEEKIYQKKGEGKWKEQPIVLNLEKVVGCYPHNLNPDWSILIVDGEVSFLIKSNIEKLIKTLQQIQAAAPFKKLHYISKN